MSGTALDGEIDVALVETDGHAFVKPLGFYAHPYDLSVRDNVRACFGKRVPDAQTREAEALVTDLHIAAVKASGFEADVIGFHGQTITHAPKDSFTWQLGDGAWLAVETGMDVVNDFRSADMKAGGQGAPLTPLYHAAIMVGQDKPVAVLNLGGVANVTYIAEDGDLCAFDCGPGNALMDDFIKHRRGVAFDKDGMLASKSLPHVGILEGFLADDYFSLPGPKSLDRNSWSVDIVRDLSDEMGMATLFAMSVGAIEKSVKGLPNVPKVIYVAGGGRKNKYLMEVLSKRLGGFWRPKSKMKSIDDVGYDGDAIEAECFGYLAVRSLLGLPLSLPETTGIARPVSGGVLHKA